MLGALASPIIYDYRCIGGTTYDSLSNFVNAITDNYVYAVVFHRDSISVTDGWSLLTTQKVVGSNLNQWVSVYYKKATQSVETFVVNQSSNVRLFNYLFALKSNKKRILTVAFDDIDNKETTDMIIPNINKHDIIITQTISALTGTYETASIDIPVDKYCTINTQTESRLMVFETFESKEIATVTFNSEKQGKGILVLRLS